METLVLTVKDKERDTQRKFTLVRAITKDKISVLNGTVLGINPEDYARQLHPITITSRFWTPEFIEVFKDGRHSIRSLQHHDPERAWAIVTGMMLKMTLANNNKDQDDDLVIGNRHYERAASLLLPAIIKRSSLSKTERKVQELNDKYRSTENAVLIMRASPIDNVLREIYDEGKRNVDESKLSN